MIPLINYDYSEVAVRLLSFTQNMIGHRLNHSAAVGARGTHRQCGVGIDASEGQAAKRPIDPKHMGDFLRCGEFGKCA